MTYFPVFLSMGMLLMGLEPASLSTPSCMSLVVQRFIQIPSTALCPNQNKLLVVFR